VVFPFNDLQIVVRTPRPRTLLVELAVANQQGPPQQLEFLAKKLVQGQSLSSGLSVLLGTPIYVALAEEE